MSDFLEAALSRQSVAKSQPPIPIPIEVPAARQRAFHPKSSRGYAVLLTLMVGLTIAPTWVLMRAGVEGIDPYAASGARPVLEPLSLPVALPQTDVQPQLPQFDPYQPDPVGPQLPQVPPGPSEPPVPVPVREPMPERGSGLENDGARERPVKKKHKKKKKKHHAKKHKKKAKKKPAKKKQVKKAPVKKAPIKKKPKCPNW